MLTERQPGQDRQGQVFEELIYPHTNDSILNKSREHFGPTMATIHLENCASDRLMDTRGKWALRIYQGGRHLEHKL